MPLKVDAGGTPDSAADPSAGGMDEAARRLNLANWEERVGVHLGAGGYDLSSHRMGKGRLDGIAAEEVGDVAGLRILHLQCHIGHDSTALAHRGAAEVLGVDFSPNAVEAAVRLAVECAAPSARFIVSDVYELRGRLADRAGDFDLVFTTWGTICWLPDLLGWAETIRFFLRPGGALYFADAHPVALVFDDVNETADGQGRPDWLVPYFERSALPFDEARDYADPEARLANSRTVQWMHPLGDILDALMTSGLRTEWVREHPSVTWRMFKGLVPKAGGLWTWPDRPWLPLSLSLRALAV